MKHFLSIVTFVLSGAQFLSASPLFNMDYSIFKSNEYALLQVSALIQRNSLIHQPVESAFKASYSFLVEIKRGDSTLTSVVYDRTDRVDDLSSITGIQKIPDEASFRIKPGKYHLAATITDLADNESRTRETEIIIPEYSEDKLELSSIELASRIERVKESGRFVKNRLLVIPHADGMYGGDIMIGYYYLEIYNLCLDEPGHEYSVRRTILDENKEPIKELPDKSKPQNAGSVVEADLFSCATLGTGSYYLRIEVTDGCIGQKAVKEKRFWVYKPGEEIAVQEPFVVGKLEDAINSLTEEESEEEIDILRYLTTRTEDKIIKEVEPGNYKIFLINFWRNRDASGAMRNRYLTRAAAADERFTSPFTEGWKTDRGRSLIIYGEPDMIERRNFQLGGADAELWYYDRIEGGVLFLFSDSKGTGDLQQVYSTKRGEYVDAGWVRDMEERDPGILQNIRTQ